jgi:hypothetical protein
MPTTVPHTAVRATEDFTGRFRDAAQPIVITVGATLEASMHTWTPEFLRGRYGARTVTIQANCRGIPKDITTTFADALELLSSERGHEYSLAQAELTAMLEELASEFRLSGVCGSDPRLAVHFSLHGKGTRTPFLHHDVSDNLRAQIFGRSRLAFLGPHRAKGRESGVSVRIPLPESGTEERMECHIEAGSLLWIPRCWWYTVESLDVSLTLNLLTTSLS